MYVGPHPDILLRVPPVPLSFLFVSCLLSLSLSPLSSIWHSSVLPLLLRTQHRLKYIYVYTSSPFSTLFHTILFLISSALLHFLHISSSPTNISMFFRMRRTPLICCCFPNDCAFLSFVHSFVAESPAISHTGEERKLSRPKMKKWNLPKGHGHNCRSAKVTCLLVTGQKVSLLRLWEKTCLLSLQCVSLLCTFSPASFFTLHISLLKSFFF